jgi:hypothetical protein
MSLQEKMQGARDKLDLWSRIAADPDLSLPAAQFARNAARSYRAAVTLGEKALCIRSRAGRYRRVGG